MSIKDYNPLWLLTLGETTDINYDGIRKANVLQQLLYMYRLHGIHLLQ